MPNTSNDMIALIHQTKAVSIWNHTKGPVFWYAAGVPGPFYVNTELLIGPSLAETLLEKITEIVSASPDAQIRATQLNKLILDSYENHDGFRKVVAALAEKAKAEFPTASFDVISGGERRDWLFSIPLAHILNVRHVFLFKNKEFYSVFPVAAGERSLHVADLINNAASYFDSWFPILEKAKLSCAGTLCVNTRGTNGLTRLREHGQKVVALNAIDIGFFKSSCDHGLIDEATLEEMVVYFESPVKWAERYLLGDTSLFDVQHIDAKSFERLQNFFSKDPWQLRDKNQRFFADMEQEIQKRKKADL